MSGPKGVRHSKHLRILLCPFEPTTALVSKTKVSHRKATLPLPKNRRASDSQVAGWTQTGILCNLWAPAKGKQRAAGEQ